MFKLLKWFLIIMVGIVLLFVNWLAFGLFIIYILLINRFRKKRQQENLAKMEAASMAPDLSEDFNVFGVNESNTDGRNRQQVLIRCYRGDMVTLQKNPQADHPNQFEVWTKFGMIGYISAYDAERYADFLQAPESLTGVIKKINSANEGNSMIECIITLQPSDSQTIEQ